MTKRKRPRPRDAAHPANMLVDEHGHPLPMGPEEVRAQVLRMLDEGHVIAVVVESPNGDLGVQVYGPPSKALLEVLEQATTAYRTVLKGH